jgi:hypothetical protein
MAGKIGSYMEEHGVNFIKECIPTGLEQLQPPKDGKPGKIKVIRYILLYLTKYLSSPEEKTERVEISKTYVLLNKTGVLYLKYTVPVPYL